MNLVRLAESRRLAEREALMSGPYVDVERAERLSGASCSVCGMFTAIGSRGFHPKCDPASWARHKRARRAELVAQYRARKKLAATPNPE